MSNVPYTKFKKLIDAIVTEVGDVLDMGITNFGFLNINHWIRNHHICREWDKELNYLIDNYNIKVVSECRITINDREIWIQNYPYCYGFDRDIYVFFENTWYN